YSSCFFRADLGTGAACPLASTATENFVKAPVSPRQMSNCAGASGPARDTAREDTTMGLILALTNGDDTFNVPGPLTAGNDRINGSAGNDVIYGYGGFDELYGGGDNDTLYGGDGNDWLYGGTYVGMDFLYGEIGDDNLYGGYGADL